jgi:hypothetical protein
MTKIYDLKQEQQNLLDALYWLEPEDTESEQYIKNQLQNIEGSVERKLSFLTSVLAEAIAVSRVTTEARKEAQARLELKEKRAKLAEEKLREFILSVMTDFDIKKVEGDILNVSKYERETAVQRPGYTIDDVPVVFLNIQTTFNKKKINEFLKSGETLEAFELIQKPCLRIS